jgi:hypothetical protein
MGRYSYNMLVDKKALLFSAFGPALDSRRVSAPAYTIPKSPRQPPPTTPKTTPPTPLPTTPTPTILYPRPPSYRFPTSCHNQSHNNQPINALSPASLDNLNVIEVGEADRVRRWRAPAARIGGEVRFRSVGRLGLAPGPKYNVLGNIDPGRSYSISKAGSTPRPHSTQSSRALGPQSYNPADMPRHVKGAVMGKAPRFVESVEGGKRGFGGGAYGDGADGVGGG